MYRCPSNIEILLLVAYGDLKVLGDDEDANLLLYLATDVIQCHDCFLHYYCRAAMLDSHSDHYKTLTEGFRGITRYVDIYLPLAPISYSELTM